MKRSLIAVAMAVAVAPLAGAAQQPPADTASSKEIVLHGCVIPGEASGTYAMTHVMEMPGPGGSAMPAAAHGRRVMFWLKNDDQVKQHIGRMVEVRGDFTDIEESEIEVKAGRHKDGGLIVEFEGPGPDVRVPNSAVGDAVGTAGRTVPEKDDVKTYLAYVNVKQVRAMPGECK